MTPVPGELGALLSAGDCAATPPLRAISKIKKAGNLSSCCFTVSGPGDPAYATERDSALESV